MLASEPCSRSIVTTGNFDATLLGGVLRIGRLAASASLGSLLQLMFYEPPPGEECDGVNSIVVIDQDGATVVAGERAHALLQCRAAGVIEWGLDSWRALEIHLGSSGSSEEAPGLISFMASLMSGRCISILTFSAFSAELLLVREQQLEAATQCVQELAARGVHGLRERMEEEQSLRQRSCGAAEQDPRAATNPRLARNESIERNGLFVSALSVPFTLVALQRDAREQATHAILRQILQICWSVQCSESSHATKLPTHSEKDSNAQQGKSEFGNGSLFAFIHTRDEVSLLIPSDSLREFPPDTIYRSPDEWRALRLCGRSFDFDSCGVVKLMAAPARRAGVPMLHLSTFKTNISLVRAEDRETAMECLSKALDDRAKSLLNKSVVEG